MAGDPKSPQNRSATSRKILSIVNGLFPSVCFLLVIFRVFGNIVGGALLLLWVIGGAAYAYLSWESMTEEEESKARERGRKLNSNDPHLADDPELVEHHPARKISRIAMDLLPIAFLQNLTFSVLGKIVAGVLLLLWAIAGGAYAYLNWKQMTEEEKHEGRVRERERYGLYAARRSNIG